MGQQSMETTTSITPEMQATVGGQMDRWVSFPISESDIRRWAIACYYPEEPPRLYWDAEYAAGTVHGGIVAPYEINPFALMTAEPSGIPNADDQSMLDPNWVEQRLGITGPGLKFQLNGGSEVRYGVRIRPGDVITGIRRLSGYVEREGKFGLMLFTRLEDTWTNQEDEMVKVEVLTLIRYGTEN